MLQLLAFVGVQMDPARQQQPPLALHQASHRATLAVKLSEPHFHQWLGWRAAGCGTCRRRWSSSAPIAECWFVCLPHIHASRLYPLSLASAQFGAEELVQGFFLALQAEPERLSGF